MITNKFLEDAIRKAEKRTLRDVIDTLKVKVWLSDDVKAVVKELEEKIKKL